MKIAMVSEHASPLAAVGGADAGGQNLHVAELAGTLAARGHDITVYTRRDDPGPADRVLTAAGYAVEHVPAGPARPIPKDALLPYMPAFGRYLARRWTEDRPDVAHAHFWMSGLAARGAADAAGVPAAVTFHALGSVKRRYQGSKDTSPPSRIRFERSLARDLDRIIATSNDEVRELAELGIDPGRTDVVPCGVDTGHFRPDGPQAQRTALRRILAIGRLVERKGYAQLIEALAAVPDAELLIAGGPPAAQLGDEPEARRLLDLAAAAGVADRVRLLGQVSRCDLPALIRSADVVAHTPWYEPFGLVPLEAMACGRPVVATAVGGITDSVDDGVTGILVPPRDPGALAGTLRELLSDEDLRARLGVAGVERAQTRFSWRQVAVSTERVYGRMAARAPVRALPSRTSVHLDAVADALGELRASAGQLDSWGRSWHDCLAAGGRLLAAGNGGSAAQAQHLTAELVGRYQADRRPFSAIALHAETSAVTAIGNDYGYGEVFARQVTAHGRPGDVLVLLSTSGQSPNLLRAAEAARAAGVRTFALTGPAPNPLAAAADECVAIGAASSATVQELHLIAVHMLCEAFDAAELAVPVLVSVAGGA
jgi:type III pantothenate kinase